MAKIGCSAYTLLNWVKRAEADSGRPVGVPSDMAEKLKALERQNHELRKASAYLAQAELDELLPVWWKRKEDRDP